MRFTFIALPLFVFGCAAGRAPADVRAPETLAVVGATIYPSPSDPPIADGTVLIRGSKIVAVDRRAAVTVPAHARVLRANGLFVVAGFQNSHVHFTEMKWNGAADQPAARLATALQAMLLRYGFTTVVDTGSHLQNTMALRTRIQSGEIAGPRILTTGTGLYPENGIPYYLHESLPAEVVAMLPTPPGPAQAAAIVDRQLAAGADAVKLFTGSWVARGRVLPMPRAIARAAVDRAHHQGKLVFSHASNVSGLEVALDAGVDVLAHALDDDRGFDASHIARMKAGRVTLIPTLKLFGGKPYTRFIQQLVGRYAAAGGDIMFGTDVGFLTDYDPTDEYVLMHGAGLDWRRILASLTVVPARRFGEATRRGRVAPGMDAELVVLKSDPSTNVKAFAQVRYTVRGGRLVYRE